MSDGALLAAPLLLPPGVAAALRTLEGAALESEADCMDTFVAEHLNGTEYAPREALRLRTQLGAILQLVAAGANGGGAGGGCGGGSAGAADAAQQMSTEQRRELLETQLKALDVDLGFIIDSTARALKRLPAS